MKKLLQKFTKYIGELLEKISGMTCMHLGNSLFIEEKLKFLPDESFEDLEEAYLCRCICDSCGKEFEKKIVFKTNRMVGRRLSPAMERRREELLAEV